MSFLQRIQPVLLSGFLMSTATSCPPERFFSPNPVENDPDDRLTCPVRSLPPLTDGPDGVGRALGGLGALGVDPESFHFENHDRLRSLLPLCSESQINRFDGLQEAITTRIAAMSTGDIAATLESLYRQAYVFNDADRTMAAGDSPAQRDAKRRLDLWAAAIDQRAYADAGFLDRVWREKRIRIVMALNSPDLNSHDRGDLELNFRAEPGGDAALLRLYAERPMENYERQIDWLQTYDGRREKYFEDPFFRSQGEVYVVMTSHFDRARMARLYRESFPREGVERLLEERGYGESYRHFSGLSDGALIQRYLETSLVLTPKTRPVSRRRVVEDLMIMGVAFTARGMDPIDELQRRSIDETVRMGFSREDAELMMQLQTGMSQYTHDRLDDYRARHGLLAEYRSLYREMLTQPLEDVFSRENGVRYATWGNFMLNRSLLKLPIFLEDLDGIRHQVQTEVVPTMRFGEGGIDFELRNPDVPEWVTPADTGLCGSLTGGPLALAGIVTFNGRSADDLICRNVELMAFLPPSMHQDHALATAIGVFGVITVRGRNVVSDGVRSREEAWTPAALLDTLAHEAAHVDWFRSYFDFHSQRVPMAGLNERRAYLTGIGYQTEFFASGFSQPGEGDLVAAQSRFESELVDVVNETLDIPAGDTDPDYWEPRWDAEPLDRFAFQPPAIHGNRRFRRLMDDRFGFPASEMLDRAWNLVFESALDRLPVAERNAARDGLALISSEANDQDTAIFFLQSDPFLRAVNEVRAVAGTPPMNAIDLDATGWEIARRELALAIVDRVRWNSMNPPEARPAPRRGHAGNFPR